MILYEHPFNERIRTWLRLERLFTHLASLIKREEQIDHHYALKTLFEIMDIASRSDLKSEILSELEQQKRKLTALRGNPEISENTLEKIIQQLGSCLETLHEQGNLKIAAELESNSWLMSIRKRMSIPGGTCEFDLPAYHAWLHYSANERLANLYEWVAQLAPLADAITNLLRLLRDNGVMQKTSAPQGKLELHLTSGKVFSLLRIKIPARSELIPEISANRLLVSMRWLKQDEEWKLIPVTEDVGFEFSLCA